MKAQKIEPVKTVRLVDVGGLPVFVRGEAGSLAPWQRDRLEEISAARKERAPSLVMAFENAQGITTDERLEATQTLPTEPWERDLEAALGAHFAQYAAPKDISLKVELPDHERGRSPSDVKRLERIQRKLAAPDLDAKDRDELIEEMVQIERAPADWAESEWLRKASEETQALAEARGEEIGEERRGLKRVLDRDPLLSLARAGHLTPLQLDTGTDVRELYDSRRSDAGAIEYTGMPGSAHDHEKFVANRYTRAKASAMLGRIERAVALACAAEPACLVMLRAVCERGLSATSQGKGRAFERNCAALAQALDVADDVLRLRI